MIRYFTALIFAGCFTLSVWAQTATQEENPATQPAPATQGTATQEQNPAAQPAPDAQAPGTQSTAPAQPPANAAEPPKASEANDPSPWDKFKEFSAISVGSPLPGNQDPAHIYRSGKLMRAEGRTNNYFITDLTTGKAQAFSTGGCLKIKFPYTRTFPFAYLLPGTKYKRTPAGEETVDGHKCKVEDVLVYIPGNRGPANWRLWEAEDLDGFPIQLQITGGPKHRKLQWRNVVLGPPDPTLFIVPDKCQMLDADAAEAAAAKKSPAKKKPQ